MSEWKEYKLKDICLKITDGSHKSPKAQSSGYPMFSVKDMEEYGFNYNDCKLISSEDFAEMKSTGCVPEKDDILIAKDGSYLKQIFICKESKEEAILSSIAIFRPDKNIIEPRFLMYLLKSPQVFNYIKTNCVSGSAIPRIVLKSFKDVSMRVPESITEQKRISNFLEEIDNKIITNRRICENLEAQAQALFKHWFIDFAPFKNGKFVESELGMIPEGWRVGTLEELGEVVGGATPSKANDSYYTQKGIAWLTPKDLSNKLMKFTSRGEIDITQEGYDSCSTKLMPKGSVLFSSRAPIGYLTIAKNDICTNQGFKSVVPKYAGTAYIYYLLKNNTKRIESMASGTTFKEASGSLMKSLSVVVPPKRIIDEYEASVAEMFNEQEVIEQESSRLSALRDTLLPKLMSGEIKV